MLKTAQQRNVIYPKKNIMNGIIIIIIIESLGGLNFH